MRSSIRSLSGRPLGLLLGLPLGLALAACAPNRPRDPATERIVRELELDGRRARMLVSAVREGAGQTSTCLVGARVDWAEDDDDSLIVDLREKAPVPCAQFKRVAEGTTIEVCTATSTGFLARANVPGEPPGQFVRVEVVGPALAVGRNQLARTCDDAKLMLGDLPH